MHPQNNSAKDFAITPPPPHPLFIPPFYWQAEYLTLYCVHLFFPRSRNRVWYLQVCLYVCDCGQPQFYLVVSDITVYLNLNHTQFTRSYFLILLGSHPNTAFPFSCLTL